jgi:hypothetical protein
VVLPPKLPEAADASAFASAGLVCDRLAEEIAAQGIARVVDRSQLDRALQEKRLSADPARAMVGFDAMIRLEVDVPSLVPAVRLGLIDLSHGNVMKEARYGWPVQADDLAKMVDQCHAALRQVERPDKERLKVRCLEVENQERNPRLAPLVRRLGQVFEEAVARSPRLTPVRHLEAASAKEESLLLLMGLSRLPGGRQFVPQADAAIEFRLREGDGRGKTFEETPIEIAVRITRGNTGGNADHDQTFVTGGTVGQLDRAAAEAWEKLAGLLREAQPGAATGWLDDMAVRRRQAEAELRAARAIRGEDSNARDEQKLLARLAHAETAVKMDPTFEDAAYEHLAGLKDLCFRKVTQSRPEQVTDLAERILTHAPRYFEQFGPQAAHRGQVHDACRIAVHASLGSLCFSGGLELTPQRLRMIALAKRVLEDAVRSDVHVQVCGYHAMALAIVGRAMSRTGIPVAEREAWVDSMLQQCARSEAASPKGDDFSAQNVRRDYNQVWLRAAELALEDGRAERAKRLIAQLRSRIAAGPLPPYDEIFAGLRGLLAKMDDAAAVAEFDRWVKDLNSQSVSRIDVHWPAIEVFQDEKQEGMYVRLLMPPVKRTTIRHTPPPHAVPWAPISALAEGDGRLYVVIGSSAPITWGSFEAMCSDGRSQVIAHLPLDKAGHPLGKTDRVTRLGDELSDSLTLLPQPQVAKFLQVLDAKYLGGKLYLGTRHNGLLAFDPKTEKWSSFGPGQGLPEESVSCIYPLDERTLFCVGNTEYRQWAGFTLELPEGKVTLRQRSKDEAMWRAPRLFWREGGKLLAWSRVGLCDDLLGPGLQFTPRSCGIPYGWNSPGGELDSYYPTGFVSFAEVGPRRFVTNAGLHEFDAAGKIVRSWWGRNQYNGDYGRAYCVSLPPDCPIQGGYMVAAGSLLVFVCSNPASLLAWNPQTDTWHGPLAVAGAEHALGTRAGVWLGTQDGVLFVSADDLLSTAKDVGRVLTTAQYRQRQREIIAAMRPLDRAKAAFSMHRFEAAEKLLDQVLADDPKSTEALLLMGYVYDLWCTNRPEEALKYYQRLADLKANPNASFSGMYQRLILLRAQKRWPEALATIEDIQRNFPRVSEHERGEIDWWQNYLRQQLAPKDAKRPAAATSNKDEGPAK